MRARRKARVEVKDVAKAMVKMVQDGMKGLPAEEQERRLKSFCDAVAARPRIRSRASGSSRPVSGRMVARGRA